VKVMVNAVHRHTGGRELLDGGYKVPQVPSAAIEASDDDGIEPPPLCVGRELSCCFAVLQ